MNSQSRWRPSEAGESVDVGVPSGEERLDERRYMLVSGKQAGSRG